MNSRKDLMALGIDQSRFCLVFVGSYTVLVAGRGLGDGDACQGCQVSCFVVWISLEVCWMNWIT